MGSKQWKWKLKWAMNEGGRKGTAVDIPKKQNGGLV